MTHRTTPPARISPRCGPPSPPPARCSTADPAAAHQAAGSGSCDACTVVAALQFGFTIAQELAGAGFVSGPLRAALLDWIDAAQAKLDGGDLN